MNKIKSYKINLRQASILRLLKNTTNVTEITPQLEAAVSNEMLRVQTMAATAAGYVTLMRDKVPFELAPDNEDKWVAATMYLVTIGEAIEKEIADTHARGETILGSILHACAMDALEQSVNFIYRIVADEAKHEECELTNRSKLALNKVGADHFSEVIDPAKVGVRSIVGDNLSPAYTACGVMYWMPVKKRKK